MEILRTTRTVSQLHEESVYTVDGHEFKTPWDAKRYIRRVWHDQYFSDLKHIESDLTIYDSVQHWHYCECPEHILAAAHHYGDEFRQHDEVDTYHYPDWYAFSYYDHDNGTSVWCTSLTELRAELITALDFMDGLEA